MKAPRGRPKLSCTVRQVRITLSLRDGEDDDLLLFFNSLPDGRRAAAMKIALRLGGIQSGVAPVATSSDLEQTIDNLVFG